MERKCKSPIGPAQEGSEVKFSIRLDKVSKVESPKLIIFRIDRWDERQEIDLELTDYSYNNNYYSCQFVPETADVYYYYFSMFLNGKYEEIRRGKLSKGIFG